MSKNNEYQNYSRNKKRINQILKEIKEAGQADKMKLFVTLTYRYNETNPKNYRKDFESFWDKIKRKFKDRKLDYLSILCLQKNGNYHSHTIIKSDKEFNNDEIKLIDEKWKNGSTEIKKIYDLESLKEYFLKNIKENKAKLKARCIRMSKNFI